MAVLKTDYRDDILDVSANESRKYNKRLNSDGTISLEDVTVYSQTGDTFGAGDINATNAEVNALNESLTAEDDLQFKFGKDGDGNYGYYGADGSLIPFSSQKIYYLGAGTISGYNVTYNISEIYPDIDFSTLTIDNFIICVSTCNSISRSSSQHMGLACGNTGDNPNGRVLSKSYDNSTGVLTITNCGQLAGYADSGIPRSLGWQPFSCEAYIVFGDIVRPQ